MILTPIPPERLPATLRRFRDGLRPDFARDAFDRIAATSPDRAEGDLAERHRQEALRIARSVGMGVASEPRGSSLSWDGALLRPDTEAYVLLHEVAHFQLASPARRRVIDFGLGAGPDTLDRGAADRAAMLTPLAADREEALVSLLGILWETALGHPALASFLDQNWLEGVGGVRAAAHFENVLHQLEVGGFVDEVGRPTTLLRTTEDTPGSLRPPALRPRCRLPSRRSAGGRH